MPPVQLMRIMLMLLTLFFAHFLGRVYARLRRDRLPWTKGLTWVLRTAVGMFAVLWTGGLDTIGVATMLLGAASLAAGVGVEYRPRKHEEIHLFDDRDQGKKS